MKRVLLIITHLFLISSSYSQTTTPALPCAISYSSQNGGGNCDPATYNGKSATGKVTLKFTSTVIATGYDYPTITKVTSQADGTVYTFIYSVQSVSADGLNITYCFYGVDNKDNVFNQRGNLKITLQYVASDGSTVIVDKECTVTPETGGGALPVTFSDFQAQRNRQAVALKWKTLSEQNNRGFNVQRNTKGVWETVAFVFSAADGGNSATKLSYEFNDANSEKGVSQYRIQQVDLDGKASYSAIRSVKGLEQAGTKTVVYPNPSADGKVSVVFEDQGAKAIVVSDLSGRIIRQYRNVLNNVQIEGLESGMYSIQVTDLSTSTSVTEKVIIKKR